MILALAGVTLISLCIRYSLRDFVSGDSAACLVPWYEEIKNSGGMGALNRQVGNYNMLYQFLIAVMTYIPIKPLHAYKILSILFDYLLAGALAKLVYDMVGENKSRKAAFAYVLVICSPLVFLNSAAWAQCDAIYAFFIVASLIAFFKEKYVWTFLLYGIAFSFKLQAVFVLPFYLFMYFAKKKFSALHFALIPGMMCVTSIPCLLKGRSVAEIFTVYLEQTDCYEKMSMNYPSFWVIFNDGILIDSYEAMKNTAIAVTVIALGILMVVWLEKKIALNMENMLYMAFLLAYTCVLFLPAMHERYGFVYEILAIAIAFVNKKTIPLLVSLCSISMVTYGYYLYYRSMDMNILAVINLVTYVIYLWILIKRMSENGNEVSYGE